MVVRIGGLGDAASVFWLHTVLAAVEEMRKGRNTTEPDLLIVIPEAHRFFSALQGRVQELGNEDLLVRSTEEDRKIGIRLILDEQNPSRLPRIVLANRSHLVVLRLNEWMDSAAAASALGLHGDRQTTEIHRLLDREGILSAPNFRPFKFHVRTFAGLRRPSEEELQELRRRALKRPEFKHVVEAAPSEPVHVSTKSARSSDELDPLSLELLRRTSAGNLSAGKEAAAELDVTPGAVSKAYAVLMERGYAARLTTVGKRLLFRPSDKGRAFAASRKWTVAKRWTRAGGGESLVHAYMVKEVSRHVVKSLAPKARLLSRGTQFGSGRRRDQSVPIPWNRGNLQRQPEDRRRCHGRGRHADPAGQAL